MRIHLLSLVALAGCAHSPAPEGATPTTPAASSAASAQTIVAATDRSEADRALDEGRKPAEFLEFLQVKPGMKVGEIFAGGGYTTELLARAVGPSGVVYGQNPKVVLERFAEKPWSARLAKPINARVVRVDRETDDPFPPEARDLDLVVSNVVYHDTVWLEVDRAKMNRAIFAALKPGGRYVVCDSSAKEGSGAEAATTLHRIDEQLVRQEVSAAGFQLVEEGNFLRNPDDTRDWNSSPPAATQAQRRGTSDRFCLAYQKP